MLWKIDSMLLTAGRLVAPERRRRGGAKRTRTAQRGVHLFTGLVLVVYVYAVPATDWLLADVIRWLVLPLLVATGLAMWQWPRLRRLVRGPRRTG
jgi:protein-S-isoprenylcysteine O-methyltransferase Ste14